jgi:hypothetical protein
VPVDRVGYMTNLLADRMVQTVEGYARSRWAHAGHDRAELGPPGADAGQPRRLRAAYTGAGRSYTRIAVGPVFPTVLHRSWLSSGCSCVVRCAYRLKKTGYGTTLVGNWKSVEEPAVGHQSP